ncbi:MAG: ankyrin repeat domain-containing protein [Planctomycetaceae bacterium]
MTAFISRCSCLCLCVGLFVARPVQAQRAPGSRDPAPARPAGPVTTQPGELRPDELALFSAVRNGDRKQVAALLDKGVKPNLRDKDGDTPLTLAARNDLPMLELLLAKGADINYPDVIGTALYRAALGGKQTIIEFLLAKGADIDKNVGLSPAAAAAISDHPDTAKFLISKGAQHDVLTAALLGDAAALGRLLKADASLAKSGVSIGTRNAVTPLHLATQGGHTDAVALLLDAGADIETKGQNDRVPLELAETLPMLKIYLSKRDLSKSETASRMLRKYLEDGKTEFVNVMLDRGILPSRLALSFVQLDFERDRKLLEKLVAAGALRREPALLRSLMSDYHEYSEPDFFGDQELIKTYPFDRAKALWVIHQGAPLDTAWSINTSGDQTCLLNEAIRARNTVIVQAMLDKGVNLHPHRRRILVGQQAINEPTGVEPPVSVAANSTLEILRLLVEKGAEVNPDASITRLSTLGEALKDLFRPPRWDTPLQVAAKQARKDTAEYLISKGANTKVKTADGKSLSQVAAQVWSFWIDSNTGRQVPVIPDQQRAEMAEWFRGRE